MVKFLQSAIFEVFGSLTKCKPNMGQKEWPYTKMQRVDMQICPREGSFGRKEKKKKRKIDKITFYLLPFFPYVL